MDATSNTAQLTAAGHFYRQKDDWMRRLTAAPDMSVMAKLVGCYLALRINKGRRYAFPKQTTIAADIGVSRATIIRAVGELVERQWIDVEKGARDRRRWAVNNYALVLI